MLQFLTIFVVILIGFWLMLRNKKPVNIPVNTSTVDGISQLSAFFFCMDHAQQVLDKGETLYPFAMILYNEGKDSEYFNFTNEHKKIEEIISGIKANNNDKDLIYIVSNNPANSKLEVQYFLKGAKKSDILHVSYTITDGRYNLREAKRRIVANQDNFLL